jgi:hypothetical protein
MSLRSQKPLRPNLLGWRRSRILRYAACILLALTLLVFGILALFVVPAPSASTALIICLLPDFARLFRRHPPADTAVA